MSADRARLPNGKGWWEYPENVQVDGASSTTRLAGWKPGPRGTRYRSQCRAGAFPAAVPGPLRRTGFLEPIPTMFAAVVLAISAVLAAGWGHDVVYHEVAVTTLRPQMIAFVAVMLVVFLSPLLAFQGPLRRSKKQALLDYGVLVGRHGRLVHERWVEGKSLVDDAVLNAPELGPVADTAALYELVTKMRSFPISMKSVAPIAVAAVVPMIVVLMVQVPLPTILRTLGKALL